MIREIDDKSGRMHSSLARTLGRLSLRARTSFRGAKGDYRVPDWRAWIALAWALGWGWAYVIMVGHARAPQVLTWLRAWRAGH